MCSNHAFTQGMEMYEVRRMQLMCITSLQHHQEQDTTSPMDLEG